MNNALLETNRNYIDLGLKRISRFLSYIGNPQNSFKSILIGGTNGKGSTTYYLSNLAHKTTSLKIGRYISPHLIRINERFVINEKEVSNLKLNTISRRIKKEVNDFERNNPELNKLTEFEIYTAIAFELFKREKVQLAFLEVGLGGRLDATNVIIPENTVCSIITNISYDHTDILGNSIKKIAYEKSGIIKKEKTIITAATDGLKIISERAKILDAKLISVKTKGTYKERNTALALTAWKYISKHLKVKRKINNKKFLKSLTFNGRFQYIKNKRIILDGAHNPAGAKELKLLLDKGFKTKKKVFILGFLDKDYKKFLDNLITKKDFVICTEPKSERSTNKGIVNNYLKNKNIYTETANCLKEGFEISKRKSHDLIIITGSLYLVGEALELLTKE